MGRDIEFPCQYSRGGSTCRTELDDQDAWCQECVWADMYEKEQQKAREQTHCARGWIKGCEANIPNIEKWCAWCRSKFECAQNKKEEAVLMRSQI